MNKSELLSTYTAEQLADMLIKSNNLLDMLKYSDSFLKTGLFDNPAAAALEARLNIAQNRIKNLEEGNGRLQAEVDTYNEYLLPRCTEEARRMIDENRFAEVRIVTWDEWNNREKAEGEKVLLPKEYENYIREILNIDASEIKDDCHRFNIESLQRYLKMESPKKQDKEMGKISVIVKGITKTYSIDEIGDIVRAYEDIKYCKEHDGEHLHSEEYLKIISLNREVSKLESIRKTKQCEIEELKKQIDRSQTTINQIDEILEELFGVTHDMEKPGAFKEILREKVNEKISDFLPTEPIKIADMLISAIYTRQKSTLEKTFSKAVFGNSSDTLTENVYSVSELRQIAEHLLVYCGHSEGYGE